MARDAGATLALVAKCRGRAEQMTEGATAAMALLPSALTDGERGEAVLVFLHADSALPPGLADSVRRSPSSSQRTS